VGNGVEVVIPQYYREGFFSHKSYFHPELPGGRYGTAGDPVPYNMKNDNVIISLLLFCFILSVIAFSHGRHFIARQFKNLIYTPNEGTSEVTETAIEVHFQLFLVLLDSLFIALLFYFYTLRVIGETFLLSSQYLLIAIYLGEVMVYFVTKWVLYTMVNKVFFNGKNNRQWGRAFLFAIMVEALLLFPVVALQVSFNMSLQNVATYFVLVLIFVKLLTFYNSYTIFFRRNVVVLQIFLYFCALEIVPVLFLWGALTITADNLKINF
jgi:hypothetical protein